MDDVVVDDELKGRWSVLPNAANCFQFVVRQVGDDMGEIAVVAGPECRQHRPWHLLRNLHDDICVLIIRGEIKRFLLRGAHESLMVVRRGVD